MKTIKIKEHEVIIYNGAEELPIKDYTKFQRYKIAEIGVGSNLTDVAQHLNKLFEFSNQGMIEEIKGEVKNLYYNFYTMFEELDLSAMSFACLVYSIDGEVVTNRSEESLQEIVNKLSNIGFSHETVRNISEEIKKKITRDLSRYAPGVFDVSSSWEFYGHIKNKILIICEMIENDEDEDERLGLIDKYFARQLAPMNFDENASENDILQADISFENLCSLLQKNGIQDAQHLTVIQFYMRLEYLKKTWEEEKRAIMALKKG